MLQELWFYKLIFEDTEYDYQNKFEPISYTKSIEDKVKIYTKDAQEQKNAPKVVNNGIEQILKLYNYFDTD